PLGAPVFRTCFVQLECEVAADVRRHGDLRIQGAPHRARAEARQDVAVRDHLARRVEDAPYNIRFEDACGAGEGQVRAGVRDVTGLRSGHRDPVARRSRISADLDDELARAWY